MTTTGLPDPTDLAEALDHLGRATGYPLWGARLALARGDVRLAYRCYLAHRRHIRDHTIPRVPADRAEWDGLAPAELLHRTAQLPARPDDRRAR